MRRFIEHSRFYLILVALIIVSIAGGCAKRQVPLNPPGVQAASAGLEDVSSDISGDSGRDDFVPPLSQGSNVDASRDAGIGSEDSADTGDLGGSGSMDAANKITEDTLREGEFLGSGGPFSGEGSRSGGLGDIGSGFVDQDSESRGFSANDFGGGDSGMASGDSGMASGDSGMAGGDSGMASRDSGMAGGDSGMGGDSDIAGMVPFQGSADLGDIHFNFDRYDLDDLAKETLNKNAQWLKEHPQVKVEIQGHCDERGTNNYNQALGERRALSAKRFLMALGISKDRLFTISYGEEKPFCTDSNLNCWWQNRRGHFLVSK